MNSFCLTYPKPIWMELEYIQFKLGVGMFPKKKKNIRGGVENIRTKGGRILN